MRRKREPLERISDPTISSNRDPEQGNVPQESQLLVGSSGISTRRLVRNLVQLVRREIRGIRDRPQPGNERCLYIPDRGPIHPIEERMFLDVFHAQTTIRRSDQPVVFIYLFFSSLPRSRDEWKRKEMVG